MKIELKTISEILNTPGIWIELYFDTDTGIWEISGKKYFVTFNHKAIDAHTGQLIGENIIKEMALENKKTNNYAWKCQYIVKD